MSWQQIAVIIYIAFMLLAGVALDGKPRTGKYSYASVSIEMILLFIVLYTGGFWG